MRTTNISKNYSLLKTRIVQIYVIASQPPIQSTENKHAVNKFIH